jgi:hypothetical protein
LQWLAARRLDDAAYGWGVWTGSLDEGLFDALRPDLGWTLRTIDSDELLRAWLKEPDRPAPPFHR